MLNRDVPVQRRFRLVPGSLIPAFLGLLLVVGLVLWTGQFIRVATHDARNVEPNSGVRSPGRPDAIDTDVQFNIGGKPRRSVYGAASNRHQDRMQSTDPIVRSAEVVAIESNPLGIDQVRHETATPGEGALAPKPRSNVSMSISRNPSSDRGTLDDGGTQRIVLQSTIVGEKRRAALINNKLVRDGTVFQIDGQEYRLQRVFRGYVVLEHNGRLINVELSQ